MNLHRSLIFLLAMSFSSMAGCATSEPKFISKSDIFIVKRYNIEFRGVNIYADMKRCEGIDENCYYLDDNYVIFPIDCPSDLYEFFRKFDKIRVLGNVHDYYVIESIGSRKIVYIYSKAQGIGAIYWDPAGIAEIVHDQGGPVLSEEAANHEFARGETSLPTACVD